MADVKVMDFIFRVEVREIIKVFMDSGEDKCKTESLVSGGHTLLDEMKKLKEMQDHTGERKLINSELWYACAGPFVTLPRVGSLVYYFPQGTVNRFGNQRKRPYGTLLSKDNLFCPSAACALLVFEIAPYLGADKETDEINAKMSL
ncbi:hypothetical protein P3S67_007282 [Capsicum chacoense]